MTGRVSLPNVSSYCVTKYGVQAFSDALRREMSPWEVQVSVIEPGLFKTALANEERNIQVVQELWDGLSPELQEEYGERKLNQSKILYSFATSFPGPFPWLGGGTGTAGHVPTLHPEIQAREKALGTRLIHLRTFEPIRLKVRSHASALPLYSALYIRRGQEKRD